MGALVINLIGILVTVVGPIVTRVLIALGISFVTYTGSQLAIDQLFTLIQNAIAGAPAEAVGLLGFLWVDKAISVLFSAFGASLAVQGAAGTITKMSIGKKP